MALAVVIVCLLTYVGGYFQFAERSEGRARSAGAYFHYRRFNHDWQGYLFFPAAWAESLMIRSFPKLFLKEPSWAEIPQALVLQLPKGNITFGYH